MLSSFIIYSLNFYVFLQLPKKTVKDRKKNTIIIFGDKYFRDSRKNTTFAPSLNSKIYDKY